MKKRIRYNGPLLLMIILTIASLAGAQVPYLGTTMGFTDYLEQRCGIVFKENGIPRDPFQSIASHGANTVRLAVALPPFASSYSQGLMVDHHDVAHVKTGMQRARDAGMNTLLTFTYQSFALEDEDHLNPYVAPLAWQEIASDLDKITDSVYIHTYSVLDEYCSEGVIPAVVSIGNESTWHRLMPNLPEDQLPAYDPARSAALHNAGSKAVRDIAMKYDTAIKVCFHMTGPSTTKWWLETHWRYGLDLDMIGISLYHGWNNGDYAGYSNLGEFVAGITGTYGIELIVMETAQLFTEGGSDNHVDILGKENIPPGYPDPPTTETQRQYLVDITREVLDHGGSGVLAWGGEWVGSDCYIYADPYGPGSSWENKAFWDFETNLHDGVNWMMAFSDRVPVTFKVRMAGADTSKGVYVQGDFENFYGISRALNPMQHEGNNTYLYTAYIAPGTTGSFHFSNDTAASAREHVPAECTDTTGQERMFEIPPGSTGETIALVWSSCDAVPQYSLTVVTVGEGSVSPEKGIYSAGATVQLVAVPSEGWEFTGWSGDTTGTANPIQLHMASDMEVVANFQEIRKVPVAFKVDMNGVDASNGVYVTGDFPNPAGVAWQLNRMTRETGQLYSFHTMVAAGSSGAYYFLNDDVWGVRESVPSACAEHWGVDRGYEVPLNSTGETFAYIWSSCDEIVPVWVRPVPPRSDDPVVELYPNPLVNKRLNIIFGVKDLVDLTVYSVTGTLLHTVTLDSTPGERFTIDLNGIESGVYLVKLFFREELQFSYRTFLIPED